MSGRRLLVVEIRDYQGRIRVRITMNFDHFSITGNNYSTGKSSHLGQGSRKFPIIVHELSLQPASQPLPTYMVISEKTVDSTV